LTSSLKKVPPKGHRRLQGSNKKLHNQPVGYHLKLDLFLSAQWGPLHKEEIINLVRNTEKQEKSLHPLERIIALVDNGTSTKVTTTGIHVARRIGEALSKAFKGNLVLRYGDGEQSVTARWER
ncbi:MAG: hypothetical protein K9G39_10545, partial [Chlorobium sp.]|nr:hypothetical protein [Chlorobium sp.]